MLLTNWKTAFLTDCPQLDSISSRLHSARVSFSRDDSVALDIRRKSAASRLCGSGNYGPERGADGTLILR